MALPKILIETLRMADGGRVVCEVSAPDGSRHRALIENSFFEDFMGTPQPNLSVAAQGRIVRENVGYLEGEVERQWRIGSREFVIR